MGDFGEIEKAETNEDNSKISQAEPLILVKNEGKETLQTNESETISKPEEAEEGIVEGDQQVESPESQETETIKSSEIFKSSNESISRSNEPSASEEPDSSKIEKQISRNQSDILPNMRKISTDEDPSMMIYTNKGIPIRKFFRRRENNTIPAKTEVDEISLAPSKIRQKHELTPKISTRQPNDKDKNSSSDQRPSLVHNSSMVRNILTGSGVALQDDIQNKFKGTKRRDGNPLLGSGYEEPVATNNTGRVPPGGFSSGLW